jgi:hypothetical protein
MDVDRTTHMRRSSGWSAAIPPLGFALMLLGAWAFFAPLVGPYFNYGFDSDTAWLFSTRQWELSLAPGIAVFVGGLLMMLPARAPAWLAGLLATAGGMWLVVGPSVYPLWGTPFSPDGSTTMQTLKWIGYFYATGALITYFAAFAQGMLSRRTTVERRVTPATADEPDRYGVERRAA